MLADCWQQSWLCFLIAVAHSILLGKVENTKDEWLLLGHGYLLWRDAIDEQS
jgi:hypothetical protein